MTRLLPPDHDTRLELANEVHARPPESLDTPSRATYVAVLIGAESRAAELAHLETLCRQFGAAPPHATDRHFSTRIGPIQLKWERHGEFSSYIVIAPGLSPRPFSEPPATLLPPGWLAKVPGQTLFAAHAKIVRGDDTPIDPAQLSTELFEGNMLVGSELGEGAGLAYTDFRMHADGCARFLLVDRSLTPRQAGRMLQRLFEIEAYRMMALLTLPVARRVANRLPGFEDSLSALTERIGTETDDDEALMQRLTRLAAEVETELATNQFRFGACRAYDALVATRIGELRERRLSGIQTIQEFMARRFAPAVATCNASAQRLHDLSERVARASSLLATRVAITRERQNQALLASMDRRAKLQLRLQQTVEGLSVAAIVYYLAGLIGYTAKGVKAGGLKIEPDLIVGLALPVLVVLVVMSLRRAHRRLGGH